MNPIVAPFLPENSTATHLPGQIGTGTSEPQGTTGASVGQLPFSSIFARSQSSGPGSAVVRTATGSGIPSGDNTGGDNQESSVEQVTGLLGVFSVSVPQEPLIAKISTTNVAAGSDVPARRASPMLAPVQGLASEKPLPQPLSGVIPGDSLRSLKIVSQPSEISVMAGVNRTGNSHEAGSEGDVGAGVLQKQPDSPRVSNPEPQAGVKVSRDELLQLVPARSTTITPRQGELLASFIATPTGPSPDRLSLEGITRHSQQVPGSYVTSIPSASGVRTIEVQNGIEDNIGRVNTALESDGTVKSEVGSLSRHAGDMGTQEFGLDRGTSSRGDLLLSSSRTAHLSTSGGTAGTFADALGEGSIRELGALSRHGLVGERPVALPSSVPQRLQMDVTLADDSRLQIDVAVQQRQVSAHLVTDQTVMRNLAVQHEGQLVRQLADAGLELKDFGAHVSDHSDSLHRRTGEDLRDGSPERDGLDSLHDNMPREFVPGAVGEPGLHFVA